MNKYCVDILLIQLIPIYSLSTHFQTGAVIVNLIITRMTHLIPILLISDIWKKKCSIVIHGANAIKFNWSYEVIDIQKRINKSSSASNTLGHRNFETHFYAKWIYVLITIYVSLFCRVQMTISQHWTRWWPPERSTQGELPPQEYTKHGRRLRNNSWLKVTTTYLFSLWQRMPHPNSAVVISYLYKKNPECVVLQGRTLQIIFRGILFSRIETAVLILCLRFCQILNDDSTSVMQNCHLISFSWSWAYLWSHKNSFKDLAKYITTPTGTFKYDIISYITGKL